jgi:hypothetical protein
MPIMRSVRDRIAPMPVRVPLEGGGCLDQLSFVVVTRKLKADRHIVLTEAAGKRHRRMPCQNERRGITLQLRDETALTPERTDRVECERCERLHRHEQQIDGANRCAKRPRRSMRRSRSA